MFIFIKILSLAEREWIKVVILLKHEVGKNRLGPDEKTPENKKNY